MVSIHDGAGVDADVRSYNKNSKMVDDLELMQLQNYIDLKQILMKRKMTNHMPLGSRKKKRNMISERF